MISIPRFLGSFSILLVSGLCLISVQAATINVTDPNDAFDGEVCSLRNAIQSTNTGAPFGGCVDSSPDGFGTNDMIVLTAQTYELSVPGGFGEDGNEFGDLDILTSVTIVGAGSAQTTISAAGFLSDDEDRVLHLPPLENGPAGPLPPLLVNIQGLTIRDGILPSDEGGGMAVELENAEVTLDDVIITENLAVENDAGGLVVTDAIVTMNNCQVTLNRAPDEDAGGIDNEGGLLTLVNTTIDSNTTAGRGGGIQNGGILVATNSTISRNRTIGGTEPSGEVEGAGDGESTGGGINNSQNFMLINSTVSNNEALDSGGGIWSELPETGGTGEFPDLGVLLFNVTVARNSVTATSDGFGGGICIDCEVNPGGGTSGEFGVFNSLIAENDAANFPDCAGAFFSGGYNLIGDTEGCTGFTATGDQVDVADAGIGDLQDNGGPTETHALLEGSPAIDRANDVDGCQAANAETLIDSGEVVLENLTDDQRAFLRPVAVLDPALAICDIGAYEFQVAEPTPTPSPTATPVPPFTGLIEGSGCALNPAASSSAVTLWMGVGLLAGFFGFRRNKKQD